MKGAKGVVFRVLGKKAKFGDFVQREKVIYKDSAAKLLILPITPKGVE